jgi:hypothetical protein
VKCSVKSSSRTNGLDHLAVTYHEPSICILIPKHGKVQHMMTCAILIGMRMVLWRQDHASITVGDVFVRTLARHCLRLVNSTLPRRLRCRHCTGSYHAEHIVAAAARATG